MLSDTTRSHQQTCIQEWAIEEAKRLVATIVAERPVRAYLFGSRANGTARRFSDIDIALDAGGKPVAEDLLGKLRDVFEESHIPFRVDIVDLSAAPEAMRDAILKEGRLWKG